MAKYSFAKQKSKLQDGIGDRKEYGDPREWKLQRDEEGNGTAVIRLLPGKGGDTAYIVRLFEHSLKFWNAPSEKYRYYIEPSPASIKEKCPVSDIWYELGEIGTDEAKKAQKMFSRSVKFISNILVVDDPANPDNNGKVFYWKYGVKLFDKFNKVLEPTEKQIKVGKKPIELFDPEEGANIMLDAVMKDNFPNYDGTTIEPLSVAFDTEEEMDDVVLNQCYDLSEFISPDYFSSYGELKKKIAWTIEKTPAEALLIENGSSVITEPYHRESGAGSTSKPKADDSATPSAGKSTYKPKSKPVEKEVEPEAETEAIKEPAKEPRTPKTEALEEDDDEILAMINDL